MDKTADSTMYDTLNKKNDISPESNMSCQILNNAIISEERGGNNFMSVDKNDLSINESSTDNEVTMLEFNDKCDTSGEEMMNKQEQGRKFDSSQLNNKNCEGSNKVSNSEEVKNDLLLKESDSDEEITVIKFNDKCDVSKEETMNEKFIKGKKSKLKPKIGHSTLDDISLDEKPGSELEPIVKCEVSDDVISFDADGNIVRNTAKPNIPVIECELCGGTFKRRKNYEIHLLKHAENERIECNKFTTKSSLHRHVLTHTNCCEICGETFTTSVKLNRHKELHDISRPYSCPYCTKRFLKKTDVNTHLVIHSEVKNILCKICNEAFKSYRYLRVHHYHYHRGMPSPFACPICNKSFFQEASLKKHSFVHNPKRRVKCSECNKTFSSTTSLDDHICPGNESLFSCELCDKKYRHKSDVSKHKRKVHNQ
ncbi:zinc finger protein 227 [Nephila pilipes]|uniref:Zinc finger protein 227 n=1 Tax=Nephila pilipes TaxID=299642 RepID=A0A8X6QKQ2_NEPPI|nr:zinc finger protein 227 [Nephila pilipes]